MAINNLGMESGQDTATLTPENVMAAQAAISMENTVAATEETNVVPINCDAALRCFSEEVQEKILDLSRSIDVRRSNNVVLYGSSAFKDTFKQCSEFLKSETGSHAQQALMAQIVELSKEASNNQREFNNIVVQKPSFFSKIFGATKSSERVEKMQLSARNTYELIGTIASSYDSWLKMLDQDAEEIRAAFESDTRVISLLEQYIIAGKIAQPRIESEIFEAQKLYNETGLQQYADSYEEMQKGYKTFQIVMGKLEESRNMYYISKAQLSLVESGNEALKLAINIQARNNMAQLETQIRNAIFDEKIKEKLEAQKAITKVSEALVREVSTSIGQTAQTAEKLIYNYVCNVDVAQKAITQLAESFDAIQQTANEMFPVIQANTAQLSEAVERLKPYIKNIEAEEAKSGSDNGSYTPSSKFEDGKIKF